MAARPNTVRTLLCGQRLADNHIKRLNTVIDMTERVLSENKLLTNEDVTLYQQCLRAAKKQRSVFEKIQTLEIPTGETATRRTKRGRPSKDELVALEQDRSGEKPAAKRRGRPKKEAAEPIEAEAAPAPKKRGRPKVVEAEAAPPKKRRGRPPKKALEDTISAVETPKKRGQPRKNSEPEVTVVVAADDDAPKRKRGRPKGSKNKPKVLNGSTTAAA